MKLIPTAVEKTSERTLSISWSNRQRADYDVVDLRRACTCAHCVDEMTRVQILKPEQVSDAVRPVKVCSLGRYALAIDWTDGHNSSIYSWDRLQALADMV